MLTPIEIQNRSFKSGIGYDKKDVEAFFKDVAKNYEKLYKENVELNDKMGVLNEGIQYYKSIEKTLQKALVLAERTSDETKETALQKAKAIEQEAQIKAKSMLMEAEKSLDDINLKIIELIRQYDMYKAQFKQLATTQIEILNSDSFQLEIANLNTFIKKSESSNGQENSKSQMVTDDTALEENSVQASRDDLLDEVIPKVTHNTTKAHNKNESKSQDDCFEYIEVED
ncbi:DivIVA domain-containing protein [Anaeromicropila herbilytica]|uniref:DivIVA domain-containing protein n=1 Tax=Anaeromicropila herbilytica TaxID=2785025 RepID=A0A7R7ELU5_9FIRM|nr:DivIVA domain-containing protein [Anaeromicropila herbilytica]BCN31194.1 hypothetical protein bsdtb5_24890 [Anaeromicropila herbilytica]